MTSIQNQGLLLTRVFDAPRELVFKVWTDPGHFGKWWGPKGFSIHIVTMDVHPGGMFLGCQKTPDGNQVMWGNFIYREVNPPEKLVFVQSFSDEEGNPVRASFHPNWPLEILNILTLEENDNKTILTLEGFPLNASEAEKAAYEAMKPMLKQGFGGTFDQLAEYLANQQ
ncbi:SRPBCC family protein [Lihuaxuella thermophila]|uniref:Uncharacterized conserved protein YndB, AHSA1/START domain n=1 Tax=Lihuaxuella thermophila TaxID=1173111 RepID=A0A1H8BBB3_9BACL|nr:SRPBCC domain-containing protein [Lihuaxuella thermophila]SEM80240.1 Uncharacterized conserved protein YndB, AHSA1/START domain [Lihuaxuella thermophila]